MDRYMETLRHSGNTLPSQPILAPPFQSVLKLVIASDAHSEGYFSYPSGTESQLLLIIQTSISKDSMGNFHFPAFSAGSITALSISWSENDNIC